MAFCRLIPLLVFWMVSICLADDEKVQPTSYVLLPLHIPNEKNSSENLTRDEEFKSQVKRETEDRKEPPDGEQIKRSPEISSAHGTNGHSSVATAPSERKERKVLSFQVSKRLRSRKVERHRQNLEDTNCDKSCVSHDRSTSKKQRSEESDDVTPKKSSKRRLQTSISAEDPSAEFSGRNKKESEQREKALEKEIEEIDDAISNEEEIRPIRKISYKVKEESLEQKEQPKEEKKAPSDQKLVINLNLHITKDAKDNKDGRIEIPKSTSVHKGREPSRDNDQSTEKRKDVSDSNSKKGKLLEEDCNEEEEQEKKVHVDYEHQQGNKKPKSKVLLIHEIVTVRPKGYPKRIQEIKTTYQVEDTTQRPSTSNRENSDGDSSRYTSEGKEESFHKSSHHHSHERQSKEQSDYPDSRDRHHGRSRQREKNHPEISRDYHRESHRDDHDAPQHEQHRGGHREENEGFHDRQRDQHQNRDEHRNSHSAEFGPQHSRPRDREHHQNKHHPNLPDISHERHRDRDYHHHKSHEEPNISRDRNKNYERPRNNPEDQPHRHHADDYHRQRRPHQHYSKDSTLSPDQFGKNHDPLKYHTELPNPSGFGKPPSHRHHSSGPKHPSRNHNRPPVYRPQGDDYPQSQPNPPPNNNYPPPPPPPGPGPLSPPPSPQLYRHPGPNGYPGTSRYGPPSPYGPPGPPRSLQFQQKPYPPTRGDRYQPNRYGSGPNPGNPNPPPLQNQLSSPVPTLNIPILPLQGPSESELDVIPPNLGDEIPVTLPVTPYIQSPPGQQELIPYSFNIGWTDPGANGMRVNKDLGGWVEPIDYNNPNNGWIFAGSSDQSTATDKSQQLQQSGSSNKKVKVKSQTTEDTSKSSDIQGQESEKKSVVAG